MQRTWSDMHLTQTAPVRTGRTWGSKKAAKQSVETARAQPAASTSPTYGREEFLLLRQCLMDAGRIETPAKGSRFMCIESPPTESSPSVNRLKKLSTESMCSTIDTLSDTSEEPDAASSSSADLAMVGAPPGLQGTLRMDAPEFVPSTSWSSELHCAAFPANAADSIDIAPEADVPVLGTTPHVKITDIPGGLRWEEDQVAPVAAVAFLGTTPLVKITDIPGGLRWEEDQWHGHSVASNDFCDGSFKHGGMYSAADLLQEADRRTQEWRLYCGLAQTKFEDFPRGFGY